MFETLVAWYFALVLPTGVPYQMGPFSTESQCEKVRMQVYRPHQQGTTTDCWYGPVVILTRPEYKQQQRGN